MVTKELKKDRGITLIVLVIMIIILLILTGITISTITGDNGIIGNAGEAKKKTEIANEKEIVEKATVQSMGNNKYGNIVEEELQEQLNKETEEGKTEVSDNGEEFEVAFIDTKRYYTVDKDGNVGEAQDIIEDKSPGDITKDENGKNLLGDEDEPYEIWCIEDLVVFSNMSNGKGIRFENGTPVKIETIEANSFSGKYVVLKRNLNFKSKLSYGDSERTDFGDINGNIEDGNTLINEMTTGTGFTPINKFSGVFDGKNNSLTNIYEQNTSGLGVFAEINNATISNLKVKGTISSNGQSNNIGGIVAMVRSRKNYKLYRRC